MAALLRLIDKKRTMSRKFNERRLFAIIFWPVIIYFIVAIFWFSSLFESVEDTISRSEWIESCIEAHGQIEKCYEPIKNYEANHEASKRMFFYYIIGGVTSGILLYGTYKIANYIFPKSE